MQLSGQNGCSEEVVGNWDELDRLVDQLRAMAFVVQYLQVPWPGSSMLIPYMQTMDDLLARINTLHQLLRNEMCTCSPDNSTEQPPPKHNNKA